MRGIRMVPAACLFLPDFQLGAAASLLRNLPCGELHKVAEPRVLEVRPSAQCGARASRVRGFPQVDRRAGGSVAQSPSRAGSNGLGIPVRLQSRRAKLSILGGRNDRIGPGRRVVGENRHKQAAGIPFFAV